MWWSKREALCKWFKGQNYVIRWDGTEHYRIEMHADYFFVEKDEVLLIPGELL